MRLSRRGFLGFLGVGTVAALSQFLPGVSRKEGEEVKIPLATLVIQVTGLEETQIFYELPGRSVLSLLMAAGMRVQIEGYSGGTLVHAINGVSNGSEGMWSYTIDKKEPGEWGVDYPLNEGDVVEWTYS